MPTPLFDAWRARLAAATSERGGKALAAAHLAAHAGVSAEVARVRVHRILAGTQPTAEIFLCLDGWLTASESAKNKTARRNLVIPK